jgi:hypothetical protein
LNDADLNAQAEHWLERTANRRKHRTIEESPTVRFERDERHALVPLAAVPYPRLCSVVPQLPAKKASYQINVQRRPLSVYAEAVQ